MNTNAQKLDLSAFRQPESICRYHFSKISQWIIIAYFLGRNCDSLCINLTLKSSDPHFVSLSLVSHHFMHSLLLQ
jgi:hypothetical protein